MIISLIVAHGKNYQIGLNNELLWNIPEDLSNFKRLTSGHHILMGRKTYESIGRPLPNRTSLVISKSGFESNPTKNLYSFSDFDSALEFAEDSGETELFIIGGAQIYNEFMDRADVLYISEVDYDGEADAYLDTIDKGKFHLIQHILHLTYDDVPQWIFKKYVRKS